MAERTTVIALSGLAEQPPLVIVAADANQVMREQLEYLIEHVVRTSPSVQLTSVKGQRSYNSENRIAH